MKQIEQAGAIYYLSAHTPSRVICLTYVLAADRQGRVWSTPHRRTITGARADRMRALIEAAEESTT
jgi:hypothetical protein